MSAADESCSGPPVGIDELRAAFAIRWDPIGGLTRPDGDGLDGDILRQVTGRLGEAILRGEVRAAPIRPSLSEDGFLVLPEVIQSLDDFGLRDDLIPIDEPDPLSLVTVKAVADPPIQGVVTAGTKDSLPTISWSGLLRLTDEVLHLATVALDDVAPERTVGPLTYGDLVGAGVLRLGDPKNDPTDLPILPRPQLGSWQPGPTLPEDAPAQAVFSHLTSSRRLLAWVSRFRLRWARGEWVEAVVALEAAMEAGIWAVLDGLLIDHGWETEDLTGPDAPGNAKSAISALQAHLGGNWTPVRDDFAGLWSLRNKALHRSEHMTSSDVEDAAALAVSFSVLVNSRLSTAEVARKHPVAAYLFSPAAKETLTGRIYQTVSTSVDAADVADLRELNNVVHPGDRRTQSAKECPSKADTVWFP